MIKAIVFDLCRVLLFTKDKNYDGELNDLHRELLDANGNYRFRDYFYLDDILLNYLESRKSDKLYIFTSGSIQNVPEVLEKLNSIFFKVYSAEYMHVKKSEPDAYKLLCELLGMNPNEVLFIDDYENNIEAAKKAGLQTLTFKNNNEVIELLESFA